MHMQNVGVPDSAHQILLGARRSLDLVVPGRFRSDSDEIKTALEVARSGVRVRIHCKEGGDQYGPSDAPLVEVVPTSRSLSCIAVIDDRCVLMAVNGRDFKQGGVVLLSSRLISVMREGIGPASLPAVDGLGDSCSADLTEREQAVLLQLIRGATDDLGARRLSMATRTYRRIVAVLMKRLSAESRFQAGYQVARLELLARMQDPDAWVVSGEQVRPTSWKQHAS